MDNRDVTMIGSDIGDSNKMSTVLPREKGAATKSAIPCPHFVKQYNQGAGGGGGGGCKVRSPIV